MNSESKEGKLLLHTRLAIFISLLVLNSVFALVLAPLYLRAVNDIGFGFDYLPDILDALLLTVHLSSFFICYAVSTYSIFRFSLSKTVPSILIFGSMTVYKYALNLVAGWFIFDGIPTSKAEIKLSIMSVTSNIVLELLQYFIVILIIFFAVKKAREACLLKAKLSEKIGNGFEMRDFVFPFKSLYSKANALQHASFLVALTVSLLQIGQLLIHDIFVGGAPSSPADIIWMIAYYVGSLLLGALGYLLMLLTLMKLDSHEIKLKTNNQ